ncbi:hypothetical protein T10_6925 [Trichinella papuae]|uniref:Uncharacterized protein n=1 Tax=Trichinella papuae TaxID=268474 RepID=A0A0V1N917_9BILA|nr:hypothetical protein T10_6925 [Trichinella papuae]
MHTEKYQSKKCHGRGEQRLSNNELFACAHLHGMVQPWGRSGNTLTTAICRLLIEQQCGDGGGDCFEPLSLSLMRGTSLLFSTGRLHCFAEPDDFQHSHDNAAQKAVSARFLSTLENRASHPFDQFGPLLCGHVLRRFSLQSLSY